MKNTTVIINTKELSEKIYSMLKYEGEKIVFIAELLVDNCNIDEICHYLNIKEDELSEKNKLDLYTFVCESLNKSKKYNEYISNILEYLKYAEGPIEIINIESLLKGYSGYKLKEEKKIVEYMEENIYKLFSYIKSEDVFDLIDCLNEFRDVPDGSSFEIIEDYVVEELTIPQLKSLLRYRCRANPYLFKELERIIGYDYKTYSNNKYTKISNNDIVPLSALPEIFNDSYSAIIPIFDDDITAYKDIIKRIHEEYNKDKDDKDGNNKSE